MPFGLSITGVLVGIMIFVLAVWFFLWLARRGATAPVRNPRLFEPSQEITPELAEEARELVAEGHKIEAIKLVREHTGLGLREAKAFVDSGPRPVGPPYPTPPEPTTDEATLRALIAEGQKIEAIKQVRAATGMGLREAKDYVESLERS